MSIISSRSAVSREGFTPYQSEEGDLREISLFSRLNLNDDKAELEGPRLPGGNKSACDLLSVGSKKRKLSEELMNSSKVGGKTFLNRSLVGKSSLAGELLIEMDSSYAPKKELSENSCPVALNNEEHDDLFSGPGVLVDDKPRFTKTKNLLRNISNYMHKFILYNRRARNWVNHYFRAKLARATRKPSAEKSLSNRSEHFIESRPEESPEERVGEEERMGEEERVGEEESEELGEQRAEFFGWVSELSIGNFNDYEHVWTRPHKFRALYRVICYRYYRNEAYCDILRSRLTTKDISLRYLVQFIEGILHPAQFYRFK